MVRGLVEDQQVHRFQQQSDHGQSAPFTTAEHLHLLVTLLTTKHKGAEDIVDPQTVLPLCHIVDGLEHGEVLIEQLGLVLGEITDLDVMADLQFSCERNLTHDTFHERRLTLAVLTYKGHFLAAFDGQRHMVEHGMRAIVLSHLITDQGIVATPQTRREFQMHRRVIHLVDLDGHDLLQLFDLLLHLHSLRSLIAEALNEVLHLRHLLLLVLVGAYLLFPTFLSQNDVLIVFHLVVDHPAARDLQRAVRHIIDKGAVMTDQHHSTRTLSQKLLQPLDTLNIQMVRGLVEQQHIRSLQEDLGQFDTHAPAPGELRGGTVKIRSQEAQTHQRPFQFGLPTLRPHHQVALVFGRIFLDQGQIALALIVGALSQFLIHPVEPFFHLRDVGKGLLGLFTHGGIVLQDHHLWQITDVAVVRDTHRTLGGLLLSTEDLQQGRFACPVLTHQGNTVSVVDHETRIHEQGLHPKLHLQSFYRYHRLSTNS